MPLTKRRSLLQSLFIMAHFSSFTPGGVIAYISSSSSSSSPESCHSDSSNGSYQSSSPPRAPSPGRRHLGQTADPTLPAGGQSLPGTQKTGRSSSSAKCGITSKRSTQCSQRLIILILSEFFFFFFLIRRTLPPIRDQTPVVLLILGSVL